MFHCEFSNENKVIELFEQKKGAESTLRLKTAKGSYSNTPNPIAASPFDQLLFLKSKKPNVLVMLTAFQKNVIQVDSEGFLQGDVLVSAELIRKLRMSRQNFRTAFNYGIKLGFWEIVYNEKNPAQKLRKFEKKIYTLVIHLKIKNFEAKNAKTNQLNSQKLTNCSHSNSKSNVQILQKTNQLNSIKTNQLENVKKSTFFACFLDVNIDEKEKIFYSNKYEESHCSAVIEYCMQNIEKIKCLSAYLRVCFDKNYHFGREKNVVETNRKIAREIAKRCSNKEIQIEVGKDGVEFIYRTCPNAPVKFVKIEGDTFSQRLVNTMKQVKIKNIPIIDEKNRKLIWRS